MYIRGVISNCLEQIIIRTPLVDAYRDRIKNFPVAWAKPAFYGARIFISSLQIDPNRPFFFSPTRTHSND